ncbi:alpha/beta fold hydrolase [Photobacterium sp. MCCC 1A19761]|uniref:alpha/beta hydrolase family protein n=1 Tax=Photobacterium sp. MCCC 1A19761 TaxID=3115000 RepID=UPI00307E8646
MMNLRLMVLLVFCFLGALSANAAEADYHVGFRKVMVESKDTGEQFPMSVVYPTQTPETQVQFGPFAMALAIGSEISSGQFPLILISHGSGGSNLAHRSIAFALARKGFVVGMPLHPGNNFENNQAEGTTRNWQNRPKHLRAAIDALVTHPQLSKRLDVGSIAVIGHSMGGYAALAAAGAVADTGQIIEQCTSQTDMKDPFCLSVQGNQLAAVRIETPKDPRIKAAVLMAPVGLAFRAADAFAKVDIPTLLIRAEKDEELTEPYHSAVIAAGYTGKTDNNGKAKLTEVTIQDAGHYAFITPYPESIKAELGVVAEDLAGFDRSAFHQELSAMIVAYLTQTLKNTD